ncbi:hypothetical protein D3C78_1013100 [compost metagenome]
MRLDVPAMAPIVTQRQAHAAVTGRRRLLDFCRFGAGTVHIQQFQAGMADIRHDRAPNLYRIILLGHRAEIGQVIGTEIDAADEGAVAVDHQQLSMQAAEQVGTHAEQARLWIEQVQLDTGVDHFPDELCTKVGAAEAVHRHDHASAAPGRLDQCLLDAAADLVLEQDEGLHQDFPARRIDCGYDPGKELLAVDQQLHAVAVTPFVFHKRASTVSGRWSERCGQGRRDSTRGLWAASLRR